MKLFNLGKTTIALAGKYCLIPGRPCPVSINLHQNEQTSVEAATLVVSERGGEFWKLATEDPERLVHFEMESGTYAFDPNRIFTPQGCLKTLIDENSCYDDQAYLELLSFGQNLLEAFMPKDNRVVIGMHNNKGEDYSIESYQEDVFLQSDCSLIQINPEISPHDFFFTTDPEIFNLLAQLDLNVVLQDNQRVTDDGSLSVYCAKVQVPYVNIEAKKDHLIQQVAMMNLLYNIL